MALKGVFVDGWHFDKDFTRISHVDDFLDEVRKEDGGLAGYDFGNNKKAVKAVSAVFRAMNYFISEGEMNDITDVLPAELKAFVRESISGTGAVL
jgi:uncharacterized protein (DUF2267 family)